MMMMMIVHVTDDKSDTVYVQYEVFLVIVPLVPLKDDKEDAPNV